MSTRATPHARSALALRLRRWLRRTPALALGSVVLVAPLACGGAKDSSSSSIPVPVHSSTSIPGSGPIATGFESAAVLDRADFERVRLTGEAAKEGSGGLEVHPTGSDAFLKWGSDVLGEDQPFWTFRAWVRIVAWSPTESVDLFTVRNREVENNFDLFVGAPHRELRWDLFRDNSVAAPDPVTLDRWYLVEAKGSFATSTFTADVRVDGVTQPSIVSPGQRPSAVKDFVLGSIGTTKTHRVHFDDVRIELAKGPLPFLGPPTVPTIGPRP